MTVVKMTSGNTHVTLRVTITGQVSWRYFYYADGWHIDVKGTNALPQDHALGLPAELHLDSNTWEVLVVNPGNSAAAHAITIEWIQGDVVRHTWQPKTQKLAPGTVKVYEGEATLAIVAGGGNGGGQ